MKRTIKTLIGIALLTISGTSTAGFAGGPYFVFANFSSNKAVDGVIKKKRGEREDCSEPDMQIVPLPEWIPHDLLDKAIVQGNKDSISALDKLIRKSYPGHAPQGLDGIIVYTETGKPQFSNFVRGRKVILKDRIKKSPDDDALWSAFCLMVPPITRPI